MNYYININQSACVALGLTLQEATILSAIASMLSSPNIEELIYEGKAYKWIAPSKILQDLPILGIKKRRLNELLKNLEEKGMIERCPANQQEAKAYYRGGQNWDKLTAPMQDNAKTYAEKCIGGMQDNAKGAMQDNAHYPNTNNPNTSDPAPHTLFQKFLTAYGLKRNVPKAQREWGFLSTLEKEKALREAPKWKAYFDKEGLAETKFHIAPNNWLRERKFNEQPPKATKGNNGQAAQVQRIGSKRLL